MENYAKRLAIEHNIQGKVTKKNYPINRMHQDFENIRKAYELLTESVSLDVPIPPSGEWLLDNFYIVEEQISIIEKELKYEYYKKLPAINGRARIDILAEKLVSFTDGNVTKEAIERFVASYESKRKISMKEIWIFPVMLKIALIQNLRMVADRIIASQYQKFKVASLIERVIKKKGANEQLFYQYKNINLNGEITAYVEYMVYLLKKEGKVAKKYLDILNEEIQKAGTNIDEIIKVEHYDMALRRVSASNCITSIKNVLRYNWNDIFEKINGIESILLQDEWYCKSDYETKSLYRNEIQKISRKSKLSETYIANQAVAFSQEEKGHVGEYILGEKKESFLNNLGIHCKIQNKSQQKLLWYLFCIYFPSFVLSIVLLKEFFLLGIFPLSEIFLLLTNKIVSKTKKPQIIPRLEEIPTGVNTCVIVPTLVNSKEKVKEVISNLEVFYLSNQLDNLYFALLGDCSEEDTEQMQFDDEIITIGQEEVKKLNEKYHTEKFFFLYRKRCFNVSQNKWLGYERKRGMITEFVRFLIEKEKGSFIINTMKEVPNIKYIITLDSDTILPMDGAKKLICTMEHPLNYPEVEGKIVTKGYGLIQPKVGITMESATATLFAKIFAGDGGIDAYSTAESNVYQDIFGEAIFTGKGIFHVALFYQLLKDEIPENIVLSHDLLEGSYLRCGLASDIEVIDGFPAKVNSYMLRLHRWTRGDWQIISWLSKKVLNALSKYKIWDNLRRSMLDIFLLLLFFTKFFYISFLTIFFPFIIDIIEKAMNYKGGTKAKNYLPIISGAFGSLLRCFFQLVLLPYKAILLLKAICVTLYRLCISKKHLLEWVTASDAEKKLSNQLFNYVKEMLVAPVLAVALVIEKVLLHVSSITLMGNVLIACLWFFSPAISYVISQKQEKKKEKLAKEEQDELIEIAKRTWNYFADNMNTQNNFLPPDNYQLGRKNKLVNVTSSTNMGLALLAIISAYDFQFITKEECMERLKQSMKTIVSLEKWNGHLYNWYNIQTLTPLYPKFVSTVDSGNFVGYLYVVRAFFKENQEEEYFQIVSKLIAETNFLKLYDWDKNIFSIGYDIRENKLVDSYYDLLASEARLASFVAIAKKDVPYKHWFNLSRTLTSVDRLKGLVSWSGTMFEYFMPFIVMKSIRYTMLDETYEFCIYSQKKYAKKLNIPWGISESAFNLQDLNYHYQYKAFGIPWLGLKRGLKEEVVVSPYSSVMALEKVPKDVMKNIHTLKELGAYDQYGFYDAIDYTPNRVSEEGYSVVKTFMAHHEALILLSINNYMNQHILQERFLENETIKSAELLLQERLPTNVIFTKKKKEKVKVLKYKNYEEHIENNISHPSGNVNILSNNSYTLLMNDFGEGYALFENLLLTKNNDEVKQGSCIYIKNLQTGEVISNTPYPIYQKEDEYEIKFSPSTAKFYRKNNWGEVVTKIAVSPEENMELREVSIKNITNQELNLDVMSYLEPVLANQNNDIVHPAYNNLFFRSLKYENAIILEKRTHNESIYYLNFVLSEEEGKQEFELDKSKVIGRLKTLQNAMIVTNDVAYSNENMISTNPMISFKQNIVIQPDEKKTLLFYYGVSKEYNEIFEMYHKYKPLEMGQRLFELAYSKSLVENRFLGYTGKSILLYHKLFSLLQHNESRNNYQENIQQNCLTQKELWKFGLSGDFPILLVKINRVNDIDVIKDLVSAIEYYHQKNLWIDLVILNEEDSKYEQYVQDKIYETISSKGLQYLLHKNGGIFIIKKMDISKDEENLLYACSDMILNARDGFLKDQLYV